jgi:hypothetical protein
MTPSSATSNGVMAANTGSACCVPWLIPLSGTRHGKIGPVSEASVGNVMLHASPGFITLVDTPTLGFCTMLAEDAADRYLIMGLENHTANRRIIILARSFLNPGRTFANMMAFRPPWVRDTRLNLFGTNYEIRRMQLEDYRNGEGEKPFAT